MVRALVATCMNHRYRRTRGKAQKSKLLGPWKLFSSVHLHLRLCPRINSYGKVQSDIDDGKEEEEEEGGDEEEGLGEHSAVGIGKLELEVLDVSLC